MAGLWPSLPSLPTLSLLALVVCLIVSMLFRTNVGLLALVLAYGVGVLGGGFKVAQVTAGFPSQVFLVLVGLTLLFGQARENGTLALLAGLVLRLCKGRVGLVGPVFFLFAAALGTAGAGNIGAVALLAPLGMTLAGELGIPPFLMAILIASGGNAASVSPISPAGVVMVGLIERMELPLSLSKTSWSLYAHCLLAHTVLAGSAYLLLGGIRLFSKRLPQAPLGVPAKEGESKSWTRVHLLTLSVIVLMLLSVALLRVDVGVAALGAAVILSTLRAADEGLVLRTMPWGTMVMVTGMMTLVAVLEKAGGLALLSKAIGSLSAALGKGSLPFVMALVCGLISVYSSSSGVVLPAFLPMAPSLAASSGTPILGVLGSVVVGAHLVDVSPLSTLGALCLAQAPKGADKNQLYRQILIYGLSMSVIGAIYCQIIFGFLGKR